MVLLHTHTHTHQVLSTATPSKPGSAPKLPTRYLQFASMYPKSKGAFFSGSSSSVTIGTSGHGGQVREAQVLQQHRVLWHSPIRPPAPSPGTGTLPFTGDNIRPECTGATGNCYCAGPQQRCLHLSHSPGDNHQVVRSALALQRSE